MSSSAATAKAWIRDQGDGHVLILGATRSGKGRGHVVPTLLSHPGSVLAFDPKGELAAIAGRRRALLGPLFVINPTERWSAGFHPLLELDDGERLHGDCRMAADLPMAGGSSSHERFWEEAAGNLAFAVLVHGRQSQEPTLAHLCGWRPGSRRGTTRQAGTRSWHRCWRACAGSTSASGARS